MNRTERFYRIDQILSSRAVVPRQLLLDELDISWATLKRDLSYLRERLNAPIEFDAQSGGYRFATQDQGPRYELPGLWFNADETHALLSLHQLLSDLEPSLLSPHIAPLLSRLEAIIEEGGDAYTEVAKRIRLAHIGRRKKRLEFFETLSRAVITRQRVKVSHYSRSSDEHTERLLSPQRLTYYRNNWYLEAWCHSRQALREFSVDAIDRVEVTNQPAKEIPESELDAVFNASYGIYSGKPQQRAKLRFSADAARWVADEEWHPDQRGQFDAEGYYLLEVPYSDPTELLMDVLRHGRHVEVLEPAELRDKIRGVLKSAQALYD